MLKRLNYIWTELKLMATWLLQSLLYYPVKEYLHPLKLLFPLLKEMLSKVMELMWRRIDPSDQ